MKLASSQIARAAMAAAVLSQAHAALARHEARIDAQRARTLDHTTFDAATFAGGPINNFGDQRGLVLEHVYRTHDSASRPIVDQSGAQRARTVDSTGAFLIGELER